MRTAKLIDVVANLESYDADLTIYATKPWTCESDALVAREPAEGGVPPEARMCRAEYFLEIFVANEVLEGWFAAARPSTRERCDRLIRYAIDDA